MLHEENPTGRFSDRAEDYARYRPTYPAAAIDTILAGLGPADWLIAADVGAGTGISARLLAARGVRTIAIEPNAAMQAAALPDDRMEWLDGTAERTGLPAGTIDLVLCAQAFHWFHAEAALREFARILRPAGGGRAGRSGGILAPNGGAGGTRADGSPGGTAGSTPAGSPQPGGRLALMWNQRDSSDPLTAGYRQAILDVDGESEAERMAFDPGVIDRVGQFGNRRYCEFRHSQTLDLAGLIGRATSASYVPKTGPGFERLRATLTELHRRHANAAGQVELRYVTQVYLAEVVEKLV